MPVRRHRRGLIAAVGVLALLLTGCAGVGDVSVDVPEQVDGKISGDTQTALQDAVTYAMTAAGASGAIVGVWAPWSGQWVAGLGTEKPGGSAVDADQPFRAGQVTRAMTCDALFSAVRAGKVSLDDPVTDYVAGVADLSDVTLGELCDGTSGLGSYSGQLFGQWLSVPDRVWNPRELVSYGLGHGGVGQAGAAYADSDAAYLLLGLALERVDGQSSSDILADQVFEPLGLEHTSLPATGAKKFDGMLTGQLGLRDGNGAMNCAAPLDVTTMSASFGYTDSGVVTDIADLGRYGQALATGALVPADQKRFADAQPPVAGAPSWYTTAGGALQAGSLIGQAGSVPGYATAVFADPTTGLSVAVVLNNSASGAAIVQPLAWQLAAIASKAAPASGQTMPGGGLPWTADQQREAITAAAVCPVA